MELEQKIKLVLSTLSIEDLDIIVGIIKESLRDAKYSLTRGVAITEEERTHLIQALSICYFEVLWNKVKEKDQKEIVEGILFLEEYNIDLSCN